MSFLQDYKDAVKIQFLDNTSRKDAKGNRIYSIIPLRVLNIAGASYYEPMSYTPSLGFDRPNQNDIMADFNGFQSADSTRPETYSPKAQNGLPLHGYF